MRSSVGRWVLPFVLVLSCICGSVVAGGAPNEGLGIPVGKSTDISCGSESCRNELEACLMREWYGDTSLMKISAIVKRVASLPTFSKFKTNLQEHCGYDLGLSNGKDYGGNFYKKGLSISDSRGYAIGDRYMAKMDDDECVTEAHDGQGLCNISSNHSDEGEEVDLLLDPEAYTGYPASHSHKIWSCVYGYACSGDESKIGSMTGGFADSSVEDTILKYCDSGSNIYKLISGIHTSISIHLCRKWCDTKDPVWRSNRECYLSRVGNYRYRVDNFFFLRTIVNLALKKSTRFLRQISSHESVTLAKSAYQELVYEVNQLTSALDKWKPHEEKLYIVKTLAAHPKYTTRALENTIYRIFDCVRCTRCKLWGKLQLKGLRTAMDILLNPDLDGVTISQNDIIALVNLVNNLSLSTEFMCDFECIVKGSSSMFSFNATPSVVATSSLAILIAVFVGSKFFLNHKKLAKTAPQPSSRQK